MKVSWVEGQGFDSNIFLLQDDTALLVDAGTGLNFDWIKQKLRNFEFDVENLGILVNTHCHFDHAGGDLDFLDESGCELMASGPAAKALGNADKKATLASNFGEELEPLEVSRVLQDKDEIDLGGTSLTVLSTPGHTQGSISLYEPQEGILFSGDAVFRGGVGRTDLPSSDPKALENTLQKLSELDVEKLYPGHGPIAEKGAGKYIEMALELLV